MVQSTLRQSFCWTLRLDVVYHYCVNYSLEFGVSSFVVEKHHDRSYEVDTVRYLNVWSALMEALRGTRRHEVDLLLPIPYVGIRVDLESLLLLTSYCGFPVAPAINNPNSRDTKLNTLENRPEAAPELLSSVGMEWLVSVRDFRDASHARCTSVTRVDMDDVVPI